MEPTTKLTHDAQQARVAAAKAVASACAAIGTASVKTAKQGTHAAAKTIKRTLSWKRQRPTSASFATQTPTPFDAPLLRRRSSVISFRTSLPGLPPRASAIQKAVRPLTRRSSVEDVIQESESVDRFGGRESNSSRRVSFFDNAYGAPPTADAIRQAMRPLYSDTWSASPRSSSAARISVPDLPPSAEAIRQAMMPLRTPAPKQPEALLGVVRRASASLVPSSGRRERRHYRRYIA